ncbi:hypothetical protein Tco_1109134 [Tanacetum coccineum]
MVDPHLGTRLEDSIQKALRLYNAEFKKEAQAEKKRYIDLIGKSMKDINNDEVKTQLPQILPKAMSNFATPVIKCTVTEALEYVVLAKSSSQPHQSTYEAASSLTEFELKKILIDKMEKIQSNLIADEHKELYKALDKDEDPPAGSDHGMKRQKTSKDAEFTKGQDMDNTDDQQNVEAASKYDGFKKPKRPSTPDSDWNVVKSFDFRPPQTWISKIAQAEKPPISFDKLMRTCRSRVKLEYNIEECYKAVTDRLDWNNPEGKKYPFDLSKPLSLIMDRGRQVVPVDYFINNDLEYLRGGSSSRKYTTSTTKTKDAKVSKHDVYSTKRIIAVTKVKVMKWYDYGYLEEIEVRREDQQLYKFKEGDFPRLHLHDIEDIRIVILKRVEDLQLGVESYQKKLNITKPETFRSDISNRIPYTAYNNPQGIIYEDKYKRNRLMRTDELYKFSDGTLTSVRSVLHDIASNLRMDYLPKRRWSSLDRKRSRIMIKAIDKLLLERRLMRSLEKFVGGRDYGEDLRLLQRTI